MAAWKPLSRMSQQREAREQELEREIRSDLELEAEEQREAGVSADEAHYRALRAMGNTARVREDVRRTWRGAWAEQFWQDFRYGLRGLRRNKGFTVIAALSLALGIGGNAAIFSLVNAVLFQRLPYKDPDHLVQVTGYYPKGAIAAMQEQSRTMDIAAYSTDTEFNLTGHGEAVRLVGSAVTANLFSVLGVEVEVGRTLTKDESQPGRDRVVVVSDGLWRRKFAADPAVVGRMVSIDGVQREVVGVMPPGFEFPSANTQLWVPQRMDPSNPFDYWNTGFVPLIARLRDGATLTQARGEIRPLIAHAITLFPYPMAKTWNADSTVEPLQRFLVSDVRGKLLVLQCAVLLVLLVACANVASLLLARSAVRQKEMALRSALGADRGRIIRQLLTESIVLSLVGAAAGLALAYGVLSVAKLALPANMPGLAAVQIDPRVVAFAVVLAVVTGLAFGLIPAIAASRADLASTLRSAGRRAASSQGVRGRAVLIAGEVALAVVLAVSAGLLVKSLWTLAHVNPGFAPEQILTVRVTPDQSLCEDRSRCVALYTQLLERIQSVSGVSSAGATNALPLSGEVPAVPLEMDDHPLVPGQTNAPMIWAGAVTPEYFPMMHVPLLAGRTFAPADSENSELVVVISAATAKRFWPRENPIGKHVRPVWGDQPWRTVVGVVGDVRLYKVAAELPDWISGVAYMPYSQAVGIDKKLPSTMTLLVRTSRDPNYVSNEIRRAVAQLNPDVPVGEVRTLEGIVATSKSQERSMMWLFLSFAGSAVLLAAIGTYGVVSFSTAQRMYEMGVRIALGATRRDLFGLVLKLSLKLVLTGLAIGVVLAIAATWTLRSFLYGVSSRDPLIFVAVAVLLIGVAIIAGLVPARRAARVDPMTALRAE
jgi:putative ABC transport system permease protein